MTFITLLFRAGEENSSHTHTHTPKPVLCVCVCVCAGASVGGSGCSCFEQRDLTGVKGQRFIRKEVVTVLNRVGNLQVAPHPPPALH